MDGIEKETCREAKSKMTDNVYIWYDRRGVLIARGTTEEGAIENLKKYYAEAALRDTYGILNEQQPGKHMPPDIIMNGSETTEAKFGIPTDAVIINIGLDVREWKRW